MAGTAGSEDTAGRAGSGTRPAAGIVADSVGEDTAGVEAATAEVAAVLAGYNDSDRTGRCSISPLWYLISTLHNLIITLRLLYNVPPDLSMWSREWSLNGRTFQDSFGDLYLNKVVLVLHGVVLGMRRKTSPRGTGIEHSRRSKWNTSPGPTAHQEQLHFLHELHFGYDPCDTYSL
jgi:hypothetical protein